MVQAPISVTLPKECFDWLNQKVESSVYANRNHVIEVLILEAMKDKEENKGKIEFL